MEDYLEASLNKPNANNMHNIVNNNVWLMLEYKRCNKKYFNGELPDNVKFDWSERMTSKAGHCKVLKNNKAKKIISYEIVLSSPYHRKYDEKEALNTLIHEMIHVKHPGEHHGYKFKQEMERLNNEFDLEIGMYSKGRAVVNYKYTCKECDKVYERTNRITEYWLYTCGVCKGKLTEHKL